jgi:hypothetical protein
MKKNEKKLNDDFSHSSEVRNEGGKERENNIKE